MTFSSYSQHLHHTCNVLDYFEKTACNLKFNDLLFLFIFRRSVYWDNNLAKNWDNIEPTKSGNV